MIKKVLMVLSLVAVVTASVFGIGWILHQGKYKPKPKPLPTETTVKYKVPSVVPSGVALNTETVEVQESILLETFDTQILELCDSVFGNHVESLQQLHSLILEAGYEYTSPYPTDTENIMTDHNAVEFTVYLPGARARAHITKTADSYETTLRFLSDGEFETERFIEDEED